MASERSCSVTMSDLRAT